MIKFSEEVHGYMRAIHGGITKILFAPFRDAGLTPPQAFTLGCIRQLGDGATVGDVGRELKTPLSNTTNITLRLEKTGLITRRRDENDRRRVVLTVTDKGREAFKRADEVYEKLNERIDAVFTPEEKANILAALKMLEERVGEDGEQGERFNGKN